MIRRGRALGLQAGLILLLAVGAGVLLAQLLMAPSQNELLELTGYLAVSAAATVGLGWLAIRGAERVVAVPITTKAALATLIASGMALLNVFIVAQLMFVSTAHDLKLLIALLGFSAVASVLFSLMVAGAVAGRVELVARRIRTLVDGDYATRLQVSGRDEVSRLATDVNELAARLAAAQAQRAALDRERRELTAAISHDLRTPLASIRAIAEALDDGVVDDGEVPRYHRIIRHEVERLDRMIDDLFDLARMDAGPLPLSRRPINLADVVGDVVDAMQPQARRAGVTLSVVHPASLPILQLDGALMERAVANLVRNAIQHTPRGGSVNVTVRSDASAVSVEVADTGPGIEPADLPHVWERFYRAERSRARPSDADGAGLGLAIVRGVVEAHGGAATIASTRGVGTTLSVRLPLNGAAA